ncbi:hypothetical protein Tsubulata_042292 [Turnera subulata]|uniref:CCHC-type domain-containing protein n=1 Tax=Turnera subulata TaxID=218843 RepID=A0A9Q0FAH4_9ROSI|nr:hypothetical protein Tsubulata_042292 [Turnera subulata]
MMQGSRVVWIYYKYERLSWFCYHCGWLGHIAKDCIHVDDDDLLNPALYQYGEDLWASPLRRILTPLRESHNEGVRRKLVFKPPTPAAATGSDSSASKRLVPHPRANTGPVNISEVARVEGSDEVEVQSILQETHYTPLSKTPLVACFATADMEESKQPQDFKTPTRGISRQLEKFSISSPVNFSLEGDENQIIPDVSFFPNQSFTFATSRQANIQEINSNAST